MLYLKQSTASQSVLIGPFIDITNGNTAETGLTIANTDIRLSKNGGNLAAKNSGGGTHDEIGYYTITLDATDTNTVGRLQLMVHQSANALPVYHEFQVLEENVYDAMIGASAALGTDIAAILLDTGTTLQAELDGIQTDTEDIQSRLPAALVSGRMSSDAVAISGSTAAADNVEANIGNLDAAISGLPTAATIADAVLDEALEDHDTQGNVGWAMALAVYHGSHGPGIYIDDGAANTNTVVGTDGTSINPVSTLTAARTLADAIGVRTYYFTGSDLTLAATHEDWTFVGIGEVTANIINLGSQDVDRSRFYGLTIEGTQAGTQRIQAEDCALQDPGAGDTTVNILALRCGIVDRIQVDTSADNVFDSCFSLVAGTSTPVIQATGAAGTISLRHYSGGIEFETLSSSHNVSVETDGQVVFNADCNVNATVVLRGNMTITDNTAGMAALTVEAALSRSAIADQTWEEQIGDHSGTSGSTAEQLAAAGAGGDPWATALPGAYSAGQAGNIVGNNLDAAVSAVELDTQDIQARLPAALVSGKMDSDAVAISGSTAAADAVEANIGNLDAPVSTVDTVVDGIQADLDNGTDGLGAIKTAVDAVPTAAENANAHWDEQKAGHVAAGSFGEEVQAHALSSEISALNDLSAAEVNAQADLALADYDGPTNAEMEARTLVAASYGTATNQTAIETDTQDIQSRLPAALVGGRMDSDIGAKTGNVALSTQEKADVNAEVVDVLTVDTQSLPGQAAPTNTPTIWEALSWVYKTFRNKKDEDSTTWQLYDDAGTTVDSKATVSDAAGLFTKDEIVSGP